VREPLQLGKLTARGRVNAVAPGFLLYLHDDISHRRFLVDTGASFSIFPFVDTSRPTGPLLTGPSGKQIPCWGKKSLSVRFGRRQFTWTFLLAGVNFPIIGIDFLQHFHLLVDPSGRRLVDSRWRQVAALTSGDDTPLSPPAGSATCGTVLADTSVGPPLAAEVKVPSGSSAAAWQASTGSRRPLQQELEEMFPEVFNASQVLPAATHHLHHLVTSGPPIASKFRQLDGHKLAAAKREFNKMEREGIVRRSTSSWSSPLHMVQKPDGSWRPCGDFRRLNLVTEPDTYPLPNMLDFAARVVGCVVFSKIDLRKGYHQIPMRGADVAKTAVTTPFGLFEFLRLPLGLRNAGSTFQRLMDRVLSGLPWCFWYLDDIIAASSSQDEHRLHLRQLFERLRQFGLVINAEKCQFGVTKVEFLGHEVTAKGARPLQSHVEALQRHPPPTNVKQLQGFLGLVNFYRWFVKGAARLLKPLTDALKGGKSGKDAMEHSPAFLAAVEAAKRAVAEAALLAHPVDGAEICLMVDASDVHVGASLQQRTSPSGPWQPLGFFSKKLEAAQQRYSAFDRELWACFAGIRHFRYMLEGRRFVIFTDHKPLTYALHRSSDPWTARQCRQLAYIAEYTSDLRHIAGTNNVVADTLSRPPSSPPPSPTVPAGSGQAERKAPSVKVPSGSLAAAIAAGPPIDISVQGGVDFAAMAVGQRGCSETTLLAANPSLSVKTVKVGDTNLLCD
jgi:hypothetical protein